MTMANAKDESTAPVPTEASLPSITSPRSLSQLKFFFAGSAFLAVSSIITRRALVRRYKATVPRFYIPSNRPLPNTVNGHFEALEALSIATINVASFMMMMTGGALWAFDISSMDDMRRRIRRGLEVDGTERPKQQADEELEEWLAWMLSKKVEKRRRRGEEEKRRQDDRGKPH